MAEHLNNDKTVQVLSVYLGNQVFGIPILEIEDVLTPLQLTRVPLAPSFIAGVSNLRGRIVTAISLRERTGEHDDAAAESMNVVIEDQGELYSILVDRVGDVLSLDGEKIGDPPATMNKLLAGMASGVHQLEEGLMLILDVKNVIIDMSAQKGNDYEIMSYC